MYLDLPNGLIQYTIRRLGFQIMLNKPSNNNFIVITFWFICVRVLVIYVVFDADM